MMGTATQARIASLKIAASMKRRITKEDPVPTPEEIVEYADVLAEYAYRGKKPNDA